MKCPSCGFNNIEGVDHCRECEADLFDLGMPESRLTSLSQRLMEDSVLKLQPSMDVTVVPENTVAQVVQVMCDKQTSAVMVVHQGQLVGVFTERDLLLKIADRYAILAEEPIRKFMTLDPECMDVSDSIALGLNRMSVGDYRHIPILEKGLPRVMVCTRDVLNYVAEAACR